MPKQRTLEQTAEQWWEDSTQDQRDRFKDTISTAALENYRWEKLTPKERKAVVDYVRDKTQPVVVIEVKGGCVQEVYSNSPVRVVLRDFDNIAVGDPDPLQGQDLSVDQYFHAMPLN